MLLKRTMLAGLALGVAAWIPASGSAGHGSGAPETHFPRLIDAPAVWAGGVTGHGVTVAILDTGLKALEGLRSDSSGRDRILAYYDAIGDREVKKTRDLQGHGTHVAGVIANSETAASGGFAGVAPDVDLVVVQALGSGGRGTYADVIRGIDWVVAHRAVYGIRILHLSITAPVRSHYWQDPLNQAVMAAWAAGVVVVASAGNGGPDPMTVGVPGNVPYVITVGAMTDNYTPDDGSDDLLASFSAAGPTFEGFVKPEVVAPGGHVVSTMLESAELSREHRLDRIGSQYFVMSGTSQAAAAVTGVAALMLQADPGLTPDGVKCRLMASARPAVDPAQRPAYSVFQQGAGLVSAAGAVRSTRSGCANLGLDVRMDLIGGEHYSGLTRWDPIRGFYGSGDPWDGGYPSGGGSFTGSSPWADGVSWPDGVPWVDGAGSLWTDATPWIDDAPGTEGGDGWSEGLTEPVSSNLWVPNQ